MSDYCILLDVRVPSTGHIHFVDCRYSVSGDTSQSTDHAMVMCRGYQGIGPISNTSFIACHGIHAATDVQWYDETAFIKSRAYTRTDPLVESPTSQAFGVVSIDSASYFELIPIIDTACNDHFIVTSFKASNTLQTSKGGKHIFNDNGTTTCKLKVMGGQIDAMPVEKKITVTLTVCRSGLDADRLDDRPRTSATGVLHMHQRDDPVSALDIDINVVQGSGRQGIRDGWDEYGNDSAVSMIITRSNGTGNSPSAPWRSWVPGGSITMSSATIKTPLNR